VTRHVAAIVVNWNGGHENLACLRSLVDEGLEPDWIVLVDNASTDGSLEEVRARFPAVRVLENERNLGYGHGNNLAIEAALERGAAACLLVNNDAELEPGCLARLADELAADPRTGVVGPRVLYRDAPDRVWAAGGRLDFHQNLSTLLGHGEPDGPRWRETFDVDYVVGCVMLVRREVFLRAGLLDGAFFAYHEDVDFCVRARDAGFAVRTVGGACALHAASHSTGGGYSRRRKYMIGVNTVWFLRRHGSTRRWLSFVAYDVLSLPAVWLVGLFRGRALGVVAKALGILDGLRGRRVTAETVRPGSHWLW